MAFQEYLVMDFLIHYTTQAIKLKERSISDFKQNLEKSLEFYLLEILIFYIFDQKLKCENHIL